MQDSNGTYHYTQRSPSPESLNKRVHLSTEESTSFKKKTLDNRHHLRTHQSSCSKSLFERNHSFSIEYPARVKSLKPCHPTPPKSPKRSHSQGISFLSLVVLISWFSLASAAIAVDETGFQHRDSSEISSHLLETGRTTQSSDRRDPVLIPSKNLLGDAHVSQTKPSANPLEKAEPPVVINPDDIRVNEDDVPNLQELPLRESEHHIIVFLAIFGSILGAGFVGGIAYLFVRQNGANRRRKALETCGGKSSVFLQSRRPSNVSMAPSFRDGRESWSIAPTFRDRRESRSVSLRDTLNLGGSTSSRSASDCSIRKYSLPESRYVLSYETASRIVPSSEPERLPPRDRPRTLPPGTLGLLPPMPTYQTYNIKNRHAGGPDHSQLLAASPHRKHSR